MAGAINPILLVEDNPIDLDLTKRAFARRKLVNPIQVARDGEEALAWIELWEAGDPAPTIILLDLQLPRVNGLEALRRLKSHPRFQTIPVVILTTSGEDRDIHEAYKLGVIPTSSNPWTSISSWKLRLRSKSTGVRSTLHRGEL